MESSFRTIKKIIFETKDNNLYILEQIAFERYKRKKEVIEYLNGFKKLGIKKIEEYIKSESKEYIIEYKLRYWQLRKYVEGDLLKRPEYIFDGEKGRLMGEFLIDFYHRTKNLKKSENETYFNLKEMFYDVKKRMERSSLEIFKKLKDVSNYLELNFLNKYESLPLKLCHGDYHPLNLIWKGRSIEKVIDWEFVSWKVEAYDIANLIGCVGMENPVAFFEIFLKEFMLTLKRDSNISEKSWESLLELIITVRYAGWISLWLKNKDEDMIELEVKYIKLIFENRDKIKRVWGM